MLVRVPRPTSVLLERWRQLPAVDHDALDQLLARAGYAGSLQADLLTLPMQPPTWRRD